jgi:hypothetical protein
MVASSRTLALSALLALQAVYATPNERATDVAYYNPADGGGSELTSADGGDGGLGEPLNVDETVTQLYPPHGSYALLGHHLWSQLTSCTDLRRNHQLCAGHRIVRHFNSMFITSADD